MGGCLGNRCGGSGERESSNGKRGEEYHSSGIRREENMV